MRFDDRLLTVLRHPASNLRDRAVQWRQLVELVARGAGETNGELRREALERIAALGADVPTDVRAAGARAIAGQPVPHDLMLHLVSDSVEVVAPLLSTVSDDARAWAELRSAASAEVAAMMDAIRPVEAAAPVVPEPAAAPPPPAPPSLPPPVELALPRPAARADLAALFRWECGPTGEIDWVEGAPRAALIGRSIADDLDRRFAARLPFEDELLTVAVEGSLAGEWRWSGSPAFFPDTGRFAGYRGIARREGGAAAPTIEQEGFPALEPDELRELVHELRTPLNAIIGFGEVIDGQYLGPAHRAYRERASEIVTQARRLLGAVEDLDLAAKLRSGRQGTAEGTSIEEFFPDLRTQVLDEAAARGVSLGLTIRRSGDRLTLNAELARRLGKRFLDAVLSAAVAGERLELVIDRVGSQLALAIDRPQATAGAGEEQLLDPAYDPSGEAALGIGFALRLVRGLASIAGGRLDVATDRLVLLLPLATS